jgi:hypothetical protein
VVAAAAVVLAAAASVPAAEAAEAAAVRLWDPGQAAGMGSCAASPRDLAYPMAQADASTLLVELLYEQETGLDESRLLAEVNTVLPRTVLAGDDRQPTLLVHEGYGEVDPGGAAVPIMSVLMPADNGDHLSDPARIDLSQTWEFPQAQAVLDRCRAALTIGEMVGRPRPADQRLEVFRATVLAACRLTMPMAAWWPTATQLLQPPSPDGMPLMGLLNVRLFRVEGSTSDVVMDTLGLQVFGLPDLQCHCHGLELPRLASYLRNAANYVFERGDVIRDGDTIEGMEPGEKWRCLQEVALIPPDRLVIDLDPGEDSAAGERFR